MTRPGETVDIVEPQWAEIQGVPGASLSGDAGIAGPSSPLAPGILDPRDYFLLANLLLSSPYLDAQLRQQEGASFGVRDQEILNGIIGFIHELAETEGAATASA